MIRVLIVAPALAVRAGLRSLLNAAPAGSLLEPAGVENSIEVIYEAATLAEMAALAPPADVLLLAVDSLAVSDLQRLPLLREGHLAVLLLADDPQAAGALIDLPARAWGVLPFDCSAEELSAALNAVDQGLWVGTPALLGPVARRLASTQGSGFEVPLPSLTEREFEVLQLLARGLANKQIALRLNISDNTVKFHVSSIYTKLGATNRTEAVRLGVQRGLVML
jgi:DNA-binding NarL/FixJ family response regulator